MYVGWKTRRTTSEGLYLFTLKVFMRPQKLVGSHDSFKKSLLSHWVSHLVLVSRTLDTIHVLEEFLLFYVA